jgi:DNA-binding MarR family transcriptional regulator
MKYTPEGHLFTELVLEAFKLSGLLTAEGDRITAEHGLSSARWKILGSLARSDASLTVPQIARVMGQTRQAVQRLVEIMHKDGLLDLLSNPNHKRAKLVTLSSKGKEHYAKLEEKQIPWANQNSSHLNEAELETTLATLKKISQLLEP